MTTARARRLALLLLATAPGAGAAPLARSIAVDGDLTDWVDVLANPMNSARDGDGSTLTCGNSTDADCPVAARANDLIRFAWTFDSSAWSFYVERSGTSLASQDLLVYLDTDRDGLMRSGEPVLVIDLPGDQSTTSGTVRGYVPNTSGGDALTDPAGQADGWDMPGRLSSGSGSGSVPMASDRLGGTRWEGSVSWPRLGLRAYEPVFFHVALATGLNLPGDVTDNMGGAGGGVGDTGFVDVRVSGPLTVGASPGSTVALAHSITAWSNLGGVFGMRATSSSGLDITWMRDYDGDGIAETLLAVDAGGDAIFGGGGDMVAPEGDSDGDAVLDTGLIGAVKSARIELQLTLPPGSRGLKETVQLDAWWLGDPTVADGCADLVRAGDVTVARDEFRQAAAGEDAWIPHVVSENLGATQVVGFSAFSTRGWTWRFYRDPNGDGNAADAVLLTDGNADGRPDVTLAPYAQASIFAVVTIPAGAFAGTTETAILRAHLRNAVASSVTDRVVAGPPLDLSPSHLLANGEARYAGAGEAVYFAHRLTNGSGSFDRFTLQASCDVGWPVTLLLDPDGDGRPDDAAPITTPDVMVPRSGGSLALLARVDVPVTGRQSDAGRVTVTATAVGNPLLTASVPDDAVVALARVYDSPAMSVNVAIVPECSTVHAAATGLTASSAAYRFAWRDPGGMVVRLQPVATDGGGRCTDSLTLGPGQLGPGFALEIQGLAGTSWIPLDSATFAVGDELSVALLQATRTTDGGNGSIAADASMFNASYDQSAASTLVWRLLSPDGATVLTPGGFVPFTGSEATRTQVVSLLPRGSGSATIAMGGLAFPVLGAWRLDLLRAGACGGEALLDSASVLVIDDADQDGLDVAAESALGTDAADADTDDDGLIDGLEGAGDADLDGVPDARECDADGDGLPDGLESGLDVASPGTDVAAGCFRPDADPTRNTDPRDADTDGGGMSDGVEDEDGDGSVGPGETDGLVAGDDVEHDRDGDGVLRADERVRGTDPLDADSDDDGLTDFVEGAFDADGDGIVDGMECDADGDGLGDGLESGVTAPGPDTDAASPCFAIDADPSTTSDPRRADSDGGGVSDGIEDRDRDGALEAGETSAGDARDDWPSCSRSAPAEIANLRVLKINGEVRLWWPRIADPCVTAAVESGDAMPLTDAVSGLVRNAWTDPRPNTAAVRYYLVRGDSWLGGRGPDGGPDGG